MLLPKENGYTLDYSSYSTSMGFFFSLISIMTIWFVQIFCVFLFVCAASLFGTIIAESNEIISTLTTKRKNLEDILEPYLTVHPR
jgi:uncharacterized protein YpmS